MLFAFNKYYIYTSFAFIGLILGSVPAISKQADILKPNFFHIICFILSFVFSIYLTLIEKQNVFNTLSFSFYYLLVSGFLMSAGIIIPGVSKTAILMMLGVYASYLTAISTLDFNFLIPVGIGLIFGSVIFMYIISYLFSHFKSYTYIVILGFVIGSCFIIWPGFAFDLKHVIGIIIGFICFYFVGKLDGIRCF